MVDCAYGYQKENQEEAGEVDENCGQEGGTDEEGVLRRSLLRRG
jgi:hypothetical protein